MFAEVPRHVPAGRQRPASLSASRALRKETAGVGPAVRAGSGLEAWNIPTFWGVIFFNCCCTLSTAR